MNSINEINIDDLSITLEKIKNNSSKWDLFEYFEILKLLIQNISDNFISDLINAKLSMLLNEYNENEKNKFDIRRTTIRYLILSSMIVELINQENIVLSFRFNEADFYSEMENVYLIFLKYLSEEKIDSNISIEIHYNMNFLTALTKIEKTTKRIEIMLHMFNKAATLQIYDKLIKRYWCNEVAEFVTSKLVAETRKDEYISFETYHNLFTFEQISKYVKPRLPSVTDKTKLKIMNFWIDCADNLR